MKVGDQVRKTFEELVLEGVIQEIGPCGHDDCKKESLTFDAPGPGAVRFFHHTEGFEVVEPQEVEVCGRNGCTKEPLHWIAEDAGI